MVECHLQTCQASPQPSQSTSHCSSLSTGQERLACSRAFCYNHMQNPGQDPILWWGDMHYQFLSACLQECSQTAEGRGCGQALLAAVGRTPLLPGSTGAVLAMLIEVDQHRLHAGARAEPANGQQGKAPILPLALAPTARCRTACGSGFWLRGPLPTAPDQPLPLPIADTLTPAFILSAQHTLRGS